MKSTVSAITSVVMVGAAFCLGALLVAWPTVPHNADVVALSPDAIQGKAAILYDLKTGKVLYQKDAQEALPLASLTKLMTLDAALSQNTLATPVRITAQDLKPEGDWGLRVGDVLPLGDLVKLSIVASSNDAAAAVAGSLGTDYLGALNDQAEQLYLTRSIFNNSTGLDISTSAAGSYGSAFDVARLTAAFYKTHPEIFALTTKPSVSVQDNGRTLTFGATMAPLQNIPGFVGAKTGYTDLAGGNLAAIFDLDIGHPVVAVVLHSSEAGRFSDIKTLIEAARGATHP